MRKSLILLSIAALPAMAAAQARPAIRQLGPVVAKSADTLGGLVGVRALSNGSVVVNDVAGRRLLLYNGSLASPLLIADSTSATSNAYAGRIGGLIPFRGDSSFFVDPQSMSMLIVDGSGKIARVMSVPRSQDVNMLAGPLSTSVGYDLRGKLIYRAPPTPTFRGGPGGPGGAGGFQPPVLPESLPILRVDLATRQVDTIAFGKIPKLKIDISQTENGGFRATTQVNPLPTVDDFVFLPDGTVAMVRGSDYHVDFFNTDGTKVSAPKIPFDWQRLTDDDKVAFIDSVKAARARQLAANPTPGGNTPFAGGGGGGGGGGPQIQIIGGPDGGGRRPGAGGGAGGGGGFQLNFIPPNELPDYKPAFFAGSSRADTDGNIWIRTIPTKKVEGGPVYDVINRKGELVDRVQVPLNSSIVGFGADGTVYLTVQSNNTTTLEKAKLR